MSDTLDTTLQSQVDQQLLEQGAFTPLELLLNSGRLVYTDYERWRQCELETLDEVLLGSPKRIRKQIDAAVGYARKMGLVEEIQEYTAWSANHANQALQFSEDTELDQLLSLRFVTQQNAPQLDMFFDNPVVVLVNGIAQALLKGDLPQAEKALDELYTQAPTHGDLAAFDQLVEALSRASQPVEQPETELAALQHLVGEAKRLLSSQSRDFLVPLWRRLAGALEGKAFDNTKPELHNSYLLAQAQDWVGVSESIQGQEHWWLEPTLCLRLAECGFRRQARNEMLSAWCYLCWCHAELAEQTLESREWPDANIVNLWHQFLDLEDELELDAPLETGLLPAWLLMVEPGLAKSLAEALPPGDSEEEEVYRITHRLISARLVSDTEAEMAQRQALQSRAPALVAYLKTRV